jgi:hypothetical protein
VVSRFTPTWSLASGEQGYSYLVGLYTRGSRFLDFFGFSISYSLQLMGKTILRLKYKRCFSFIFMSSYAEMGFI